MYPSHALPRRVSPNRVTILLAGLFLALAWTGPAFSAPVQNAPGKRADAENLTHSLVGLNTAYQKASPNAKSQALQKLIGATVERQALLAELIESDPGAVLRTAMPAHIRNQMPAEIQAFIERRLELEGELEVMYEDYADGFYRLRHSLKTDGGRIALHFKSPPDGLLSGTPAKVSGVLVEDAMAVDSGKDDVQMLACCDDSAEINAVNPAPDMPDTLGEQPTLILLVNFQDDSSNRPWTHEEVAEVVFGHASDFFYENSSGQTWLSGDTHGWYTIAVDSSGCDDDAIVEQANQAAAADGVDLAAYQRIGYFHPLNGCGWTGVASGGGDPSTFLMNGSTDPHTVGHEIGHNLGLDHAHGLECGDEILGPDCQSREYSDSLDIMGQRTAHFNAFHKERLGWLDSAGIRTVESDGSYALEPYAAPQGADPKTLKILQSTDPVSGRRTWYYLEYRQATGFDSGILTDPAYDSDNILNGVVIRLGTEADSDSSNMLDMMPGSAGALDWFDVALTTGRSYSDPAAGITVTTDWADAGGAMVSVSVSPQAPVCSPADPALDAAPGESDWVAPGTAVDFAVTVTNSGSAACDAVVFDLDAVVDSGWSAVFSPSALTVEPGASASANLTVTSPQGAADGFYPVDVSAHNRGDGTLSAAASVSYVVSAPAEPPANNSPVAVNDSVTISSKSAIEIAVLANDSDPDGDELTVVGYSDGAKGSVSLNSDGTLTYTPARRFKRSDSFSYTVSDGLDTASATVSITLESSGGSGGGKGKGKKG